MEDLPLRDIHLPDPVSWWPPAPGWWLLAGVALGLLVYALIAHRRRRVRRAALRMLAEIERDYTGHGDDQRLAADVSALLRRVCLTYEPREAVASLTGAAWRDHLVSLPAARDALDAAIAEQIVTGPYNPAQRIEARRMLEQTRRWLGTLAPLRGAG